MSNLTIFVKNSAALILLLGLVACKQAPVEHTYLSNITENQLLQGKIILGYHLQESELPEDDVLAISPEMEAFVRSNLQSTGNYFGKVRQLSRSIFDENKLGLAYDPLATYSARGTFENSVANCLSFSFLYYTLLDENYVVALYYSNIGAELLIENKTQDALRYFVKAIRLDYDNSAHWTNLGVLYRRSGYDDLAEKAYYVALDFNKDDKAALSNLAHLYREAGDDQRADYFSDLVKKYHSGNPYYFYSEAKDAVEEGELKKALNNINKAISKNKNIAVFYELKRDILNQLGNSTEASRALRKARDISAEML